MTVTNKIDKSGPNAPTLSSPSDSGFVNTTKPTLSWSAPSDNGCSSVA